MTLLVIGLGENSIRDTSAIRKAARNPSLALHCLQRDFVSKPRIDDSTMANTSAQPAPSVLAAHPPSPPPNAASPPSKRDLTSWWKQFKKNSKKDEEKGEP